MSSSQQLFPGQAIAGGGGTPPDDPLAAYVISFLRFEDVGGTTIPVDEIPGVTWGNNQPLRAVVSGLQARGGNRSLARPVDGGGAISGGLFTTLATLIGNQWTLEMYQRFTTRSYGGGNNRFFALGRNSAHQFAMNTVSGNQILLEWPGGSHTLTAVMDSNIWYHVAVVSDGTTVKTYLDHVLVHTRTYNASFSGNVTPVEYSPGRAYNLNGDFYDGYTDEARLTLAARTPSQFLPVAGYTAPGDARARSLAGLAMTMNRGILGGGVSVNRAGLTGLRSNAATGELTFPGYVSKKLAGMRMSAINGAIASWPYGELRWGHQDYMRPGERQAIITLSLPPGTSSADNNYLEVVFNPDGTTHWQTIQDDAVYATGALDRWLSEALPLPYLLQLDIGGDIFHGGDGVGAGGFPDTHYGAFLATPWRMRMWMVTPPSSGHYTLFSANIAVSYDTVPLGPPGAWLRSGGAGSYDVQFNIVP